MFFQKHNYHKNLNKKNRGLFQKAGLTARYT